MVAGMAEQPQTTKVALVVILAIALGIVLVIQSGLFPMKSGGAGPVVSTVKSGESAAPVSDENGITVKPRTVWSRPDSVGSIDRDPTRMNLPPAVVSSSVAPVATPPVIGDPEYSVVGIVYSTEQPSAIIIDGHVLHEGDTILGAVIVKISEGSAELRRSDKSWVVRPGEQYRGSEVIRSQRTEQRTD
jgi:hypothetical protein